MEKLLTDIEQKELNKFGLLELTASQTYLHLSNRMKSLSYFGAEKFFLSESNSEREHYGKLEKFANDLGFPTTKEEVQSVIDQTDPLLFYLKNKINRIRPFQLSYYLSMPLYPLIHSDANSAAYPSGHGLDSFNLANYFSTKYPEKSKEFTDLGNRIAFSREQIGVHYPSDTEISRMIAKTIWENKLIDIK